MYPDTLGIAASQSLLQLCPSSRNYIRSAITELLCSRTFFFAFESNLTQLPSAWCRFWNEFSYWSPAVMAGMLVLAFVVLVIRYGCMYTRRALQLQRDGWKEKKRF